MKDDSVLEEAVDNLREVVNGRVGAPVVLVNEEHMERATAEHRARGG